MITLPAGFFQTPGWKKKMSEWKQKDLNIVELTEQTEGVH